jgi:hypothetical protein
MRVDADLTDKVFGLTNAAFCSNLDDNMFFLSSLGLFMWGNADGKSEN